MLSLFPILTRPNILTFKNNWSKRSFINKQFWRDLLVLCCVTYLLFGLYKLSTKGFGILHQYHEQTHAFLPSVFSGLILTLLILVFFSSCTFSLTNLYLSEDLELIMASPISKFKFFYNKYFQIFVSSSWIIYLSSLPCILGLASIYKVENYFYPQLALISLPLLIIPVSLAIICITLLTRFISGNNLRIILPVLTVILLLSVFTKSHAFFETAQKKDIGNVLEILGNINMLNSQIGYLSWLGKDIANLLRPDSQLNYQNIVILYCIALLITLLSYLSISLLHNASLTRIRNASKNLNLSSKHSQHFIRIILPFIKKPLRAMMLKEFKIFARDFSHLIQVSIILIICLFYLYNFQHIFNTKNYFTVSLVAWQNITFLCNIGFGTLIITSLCTRFVYSSLSLEGRSLWILVSSPLSINDILHNKLKTWYFPVLLFSIVIFVSGCFALQSEPYLIAITILVTIITSWSITSLAVGSGAVFSSFNWVHNSQIFASIGSLFFIFSAVMLTIANILLIAVILFLPFIQHHTSLNETAYYLILGFLILTFFAGNLFLSRQFMKFGVKSLTKKIL